MIRSGAIKSFVAVVLACGALAACDSNSGTSPDEHSDPAVPIRVSLNDRPVLALESNPTTGFSWGLGRPLDESIVRLESSRYVDGKSTLLGSGGLEYWTFTAVGRGSTTILMRYAQPWQEAGATTSEFRIEVK
jgi:inhibitor of cysteine peptidase